VKFHALIPIGFILLSGSALADGTARTDLPAPVRATLAAFLKCAAAENIHVLNEYQSSLCGQRTGWSAKEGEMLRQCLVAHKLWRVDKLPTGTPGAYEWMIAYECAPDVFVSVSIESDAKTAQIKDVGELMP
jgi:hypothetical protein